MNRRLVLVLLGLTVSIVVVKATEKPGKEFQDAMRSNGSIVDISRGTVSSVSGGVENVVETSLRAHMKAKDYRGIAADAATLRANFVRVQAYWAERKTADAIEFSKAGIKAATDLEAAAKAQDDAHVSASATAVAATCRGCHQAHRAVQLADGLFAIM